MEENEIKSTATLFANYRMPQSTGKRLSERGELLQYFSDKLGWPVGRVAGRLRGMQDLNTLYFIKSSADAYEREGNPWSKCFNGMLRVR